ncbi:MAG TPA: DUF488 family protein [Steroidobacteraceae bacterium]|jgi:uncharacterized protein YeaO (DUF488 family)
MGIRIVQLGSPRLADEGLRIGTVRRPPRGVPKTQFAARNFYDVWLPALSPSAPLVREALSAKTSGEWQAFCRKFKAQMRDPDAARLLDLLAALSTSTNFSVGCYCDDAARCHRSVLRELLIEHGATLR